ncbi:MAG: hypothetical protein Q9171_000306 [Xanthocarpia ochracea]
MERVLLSVVALLALATFASAQSMATAQTSASIFIVNADPQPLVGSIVSMKGATTTYQIQCSAGTDSEECGFPDPFTYIKDGTSSIAYALGIGGVTATVKCSVQGTVSAVCTASGDIPSEESGAPAQATDITTTLEAEQFRYTQIPITGGIPVPSVGASATATSTSPSTKRTSMTTGSTSSQTGSASSQSDPSPAAANPTGTTGDATSLDRNSLIALAGAAALAALFM